MKYSASNSDSLCSWSAAAKRGGTTPENPVVGEPRFYNVDAWLEVDGGEPANITDKWLSELPEELRKPYLKELGLPVKKALIYKENDGTTRQVIDVKITDVWDGWCNIAVKFSDGQVPKTRVHSMHFAEMNSGSTESDGTNKANARKASCPSQKKSKPVDGMPLDFIVLDLETTGRNSKVDDICEIAALKIKDGEVVDKFEQLVYIDGEMPEEAEAKHHISQDMLENAPHMKAAMSAFLNFIGTSPVLVGHNIKTFDIKLLERVASACDLAFTYSELIDTLTLARRAWPNLPKYTMDALRERLDLEDCGAHRALKDCSDVFDLYMRIRHDVAEGKASIQPPHRASSASGQKWSKAWDRKKAKEFTAAVEEFDESHPLYGKRVVLSGDIEGHSYNEVLQYVCDCGGIPQDSVTRGTDYLIVGSGAGKGKTDKARANQEKGIPTVILDEAAFRQLVGWE